MLRILACLTLASLVPALAQGGQEVTKKDDCTAPAGIAGAYKGVFYDNDFGYLDDPCLKEADPRDALSRASDRLKLMDIAPDLRLSLGGEARLRYHVEDGIGLSRLDGKDDEFVLSRIRAYADIRIADYFRGYVEIVDARKSGGRLPPRGTEAVRGDVLNGFGEIRVPIGRGQAYVRAGRQELLFGKQRFISPLDWGNTRRSFDGVRGSYIGHDFELHGWFANPRVIADRESLRDTKSDFSGLYGIWNGLPLHRIELYALNLDRDPQSGAGSNFWTLGTRIDGKEGPFTWEAEFAFQTGTDRGEDMRASSLSLTAGVDFAKRLPFAPALSLAYDRASGDGDPDDGKARTFNQLFPLAHAWLGFADLVARQNIEAWSLSLKSRPAEGVRLAATVHDFALENARGALFNSGGAAIRQDASGNAGRDVGREIDIVAGFSPSRGLDLEIGYSRFLGGRFVRQTAGAGISENADFFYLQTKFRF